jgi:hypothetical protein
VLCYGTPDPTHRWIRDIYERFVTPKWRIDPKVKEGYAPLLREQDDFYQRRMFGRIEDCWARPICSRPGAYIDVIHRKRDYESNQLRFVLRLDAAGDERVAAFFFFVPTAPVLLFFNGLPFFGFGANSQPARLLPFRLSLARYAHSTLTLADKFVRNT